jgi:hypothetical protein
MYLLGLQLWFGFGFGLGFNSLTASLHCLMALIYFGFCFGLDLDLIWDLVSLESGTGLFYI